MSKPKGIDVSGHQPNINWQVVKGQGGLSFCFVKATEGTGYTNPLFKSQWVGARVAGLLRSPFHFFRWDVAPEAQAAYFLKALGSDRGELPLTVDIEAPGDGSGNMNYGAVEAGRRIRVFVEAIKAATGRAPIIYTYPDVWRNKLGNNPNFTDCPLWIANYNVPVPNLPGAWSKYAFWQYSDKGTVAGVSGIVDVNLFNGSLDELRAFAGIQPAPPPQTEGSRYFPETGQYVGGGFLGIWKKLDALEPGLALYVMGYPKSGEYQEGDYILQDFENVQTEWKPGQEARIRAYVRITKYGS